MAQATEAFTEAPRSRPGTQRGPSAAPSDGANWTRPAIAEAYRLHMKGKLVGDEWNRIEQSIIQRLLEGIRVVLRDISDLPGPGDEALPSRSLNCLEKSIEDIGQTLRIVTENKSAEFAFFWAERREGGPLCREI